MTVADLVVSFRDAGQPRALASRMIAVAHRHPRGWSVNITATNATRECPTFDGVPAVVTQATSVRNLLIHWPERDAS